MVAANNSTRRIRNRYLPQTPLELLILCIMFLLGAILWFQDVNFVLRIFYSEYSVIILILLLFEFLLLKSFDRSQVYKSERDQLQRARQEELIIARKVENALEDLSQILERAGAAGQANAAELEEIREQARNALLILRAR